MSYDTMEAGRELDALVAEKVMGWTAVFRLAGGNIPYGFPDDDYNRDVDEHRKHGTCGFPTDYHREPIPEYSTDISAAWEVVEHFRQRQWTVKLVGHEWYDGGRWECTLLDALDTERSRALDTQRHNADKQGWDEPSAPLAICRAALKAIEEVRGA